VADFEPISSHNRSSIADFGLKHTKQSVVLAINTYKKSNKLNL
jgi:hypothetical protein